ncbi:phytoene desaturase family protein [Elongatibacter sediminis]|uniref:Pyridine nucleotide-disulfide oxidoreductase domain-containing protein 2 n=1 Tax=Elongatibacter sediminis TaxID=3119006 RepID=A0AAW9RM30_9GAMM
MTDGTNVIIIGAGHNGLTCAAYLAKAGRHVTVLEAANRVGGAATTREFAPDFRVSACAHLLYLMNSDIRRELGLDAKGLSLARQNLKTVALAADGNHLLIAGDRIDGEDVTDEDRQALREYRRFMKRFARIIGRLHDRVPPRIASGERSDLIGLGRLALDVRLLGRDDMREFLRIAGINIFDVLQENFSSDRLKGALALDAVLGTHLGPRSNNSVFTALHRMSGNAGETGGEVSLVKGGMGALSDALARAAIDAGAEIRTGTAVRRIVMDFDRVCGVELESGEVIEADTVASSADPKTTFLGLLGAANLEAGFAHRIQHLRARGNAAKLHLALSELPEFSGLDTGLLGERLVIAPDLNYVEHAFNHAKYGEFSAEPVMEITLPSLHDSSLAPQGQHVLSAVVQYAPAELKQGWPEGKAAFTETVMSVLERYAPDIRSKAVVAELLTPADLESEFRMAGGHWHHGELSLDQFLMLRPVPGAAQYRAPVDGLFLCGAGSHPGGGVMGSAGRNAAHVILGKS